MFEYSKFDDTSENSSVTLKTNPDVPIADQIAPSHRDRLKAILSSKPIHIIVLCLIILDCIFVLIELLIDTDSVKIEENNPFPDIIHGFSIAVLSAFMVEIGLKIYVDYKHFFSHKIEILDGVVVLISFVVDIVLTFYEDNDFLFLASFLILLRLVRIVNGFVVTAKAQADERVHSEKKKNKKLNQTLEEAETKIKLRDEEIRKLSKLLSDHGIEYEQLQDNVDYGFTNV